jgi:hypothetical protein
MHDDIVNLTRRGRRALRAGLDGLSAETQLAMEILKRTGTVTAGHLDELVGQCIDHYGSAERALTALKSGRVRLDKVIQPDD